MRIPEQTVRNHLALGKKTGSGFYDYPRETAKSHKHDRIHHEMPFMRATASPEEIKRFHLERGDVLITKDSEAWNDIGVPALVEEPADDLICGYHLALLRPLCNRLRGGYLFRALQSTAVAYQFHVEATGVTRYGLSHSAIKSIWLPLPPLPEQATIVRFLDHADRSIRRYIRAKQKLIALLEEQKQAIIKRCGHTRPGSQRPSQTLWRRVVGGGAGTLAGCTASPAV